VLFADEPTGALNSSMSTEVMNALTDVHGDGTTIVMVTHDPACAARADRVVYLRDGLLVDTREHRA
jgi:putative ABC transport system ATP-binding protein